MFDYIINSLYSSIKFLIVGALIIGLLVGGSIVALVVYLLK